ncbi:hypothetical protein BKA82DRAFT_4190522 [Pisolithus tinctorius]|nr:hypothetical protein BKA82DRAFT_4190522 [Pisolithus tinctorius]
MASHEVAVAGIKIQDKWKLSCQGDTRSLLAAHSQLLPLPPPSWIDASHACDMAVLLRSYPDITNTALKTLWSSDILPSACPTPSLLHERPLRLKAWVLRGRGYGWNSACRIQCDWYLSGARLLERM